MTPVPEDAVTENQDSFLNEHDIRFAWQFGCVVSGPVAKQQQFLAKQSLASRLGARNACENLAGPWCGGAKSLKARDWAALAAVGGYLEPNALRYWLTHLRNVFW